MASSKFAQVNRRGDVVFREKYRSKRYDRAPNESCDTRLGLAELVDLDRDATGPDRGGGELFLFQ